MPFRMETIMDSAPIAEVLSDVFAQLEELRRLKAQLGITGPLTAGTEERIVEMLE